MDYRVKRIFGTLFITALVVLLWALITGTAHAQTAKSQASIFSTPQLFQALPTAQALCLEGPVDGANCTATSAIANELLSRGALKAASTATIDKLRLIVVINEDCLRTHVCSYDAPMLVNTLATQLNFNHVAPADFLRAYEQWYGELHALGPVFAPVLDTVAMNVQRARANGL